MVVLFLLIVVNRERMGGACSEDALVALAERLPVPEIAKLAKPEFFEQL
jgi:hypothetical protein